MRIHVVVLYLFTCRNRRSTFYMPEGTYEQFLIFPQCFQKVCFLGASKGVLCGNWLIKCRIIKLIASWGTDEK